MFNTDKDIHAEGLNGHPNTIAMSILGARGELTDSEIRTKMLENGYTEDDLNEAFKMADIGRIIMTRKEAHKEVDKYFDVLEKDNIYPRCVVGSYDVNGVRSVCIQVLSDEEMKA